MKIATKDIENFLKQVPKSIKAILLYGPDNGLVKIRANILTNNKELLAHFNYDQIKNNPNILLDNFNSLSLFSNSQEKEKIILIECNNTNLNEVYVTFLKEANYKGLLVFYAAELGTDSSLRKFFETNNNVAAIACYQDDNLSITRLIQQSFKDKKINITADTIATLTNYIPVGDRMLILNEIEKISLFLADKNNFSKEDLKNYLEQHSEVSFDKLCYQISLKQLKSIDSLIDKLQNEGHNLVAIVRMIIRHFYRIYQVKQLISQGKTEQHALDSLSPPVFFKHVNDFNNSIKLWSKNELQDFLKQLTKAELTAKQSPLIAELTLKNIFQQIKI